MTEIQTPAAAPGTAQDIRSLMPQLEEELARLVAIPSVSAPGFPEPRQPLLDTYELIVGLLREAGVEILDALELPDTAPVIIAIPRSATVSVGTPGRKLPMSPITIASASNSSGRDGGKVLNALPTSSIPSITILIPTGGRPSQARSAPTCMRMFDLVSAAPRP